MLEQHVGTGRRATRPRPAGDRGVEALRCGIQGLGRHRQLPIDLHPSTGGDNYIDIARLPFQIPLGALIAGRVENLLPACKNLGVTHITNGCYRLHPVEWNIGEAAGRAGGLLPRHRSAMPREVRPNQLAA